MSSVWDKIAGVIATGKESLGLQDVNLIPGDVNKKLTGVNSNFIYGTPTSEGNRTYDAQTKVTSPNLSNDQRALPYNAPTPSPTPAPSGGSGGGGGNYSFGDPNNPDLSNPAKQTDYNNFIEQQKQSQTDSAAAQAEARRRAAQAKYQAAVNIAGKARETAKGRYDWLIGSIGSNKEDLLSKVNLSEEQGLENYNTQKEQTTRQYDQARQEILSTYRDLNTQQEKILRGSGTASSSRSQEAQLRLNNLLGKDLNGLSTNEADSLALIGNAITNLQEESRLTRQSIEREASGKMDEAALSYSEKLAAIDSNLELSAYEKEAAYAEAEANLASAVAQIDAWASAQQFEYQKYEALQKDKLDNYIVNMTDASGLLNAGIQDKTTATNELLSSAGFTPLQQNAQVADTTVGNYQKPASKEELDRLLASGQITQAQYQAQLSQIQQPTSSSLASLSNTPIAGASASLRTGTNAPRTSVQNRIVNQDPLLASILA